MHIRRINSAYFEFFQKGLKVVSLPGGWFSYIRTYVITFIRYFMWTTRYKTEMTSKPIKNGQFGIVSVYIVFLTWQNVLVDNKWFVCASLFLRVSNTDNSFSQIADFSFCSYFVYSVHLMVKESRKFSSIWAVFVCLCAHAVFVMASCQCFVSSCSWVCCVRGADPRLIMVTICPLLTPLFRVGIPALTSPSVNSSSHFLPMCSSSQGLSCH